jgi:hypothetical protein
LPAKCRTQRLVCCELAKKSDAVQSSSKQFKAVQSSSKQFKAVQSSSKHQIYIYVTATQQYIYFAVQSSSKQFKAPHIYKSKPNYAASA